MAKPLPITFAKSAIQDLEEIRDYYLEQQIPEVGDRILREIVSLIEKIPAHPDRGKVVPEFSQSPLRELIHPPFRIVYRRDRKRISIVRIWRSERLML
ncbi:MAG: type II toxin-antitoxin system RelE/ParE family toxin [Desulfuromonadales bacterium]|nr:type II toxin-antitoxin system RelE/ParE family toxin [Chloroflexota bacterium]MCK4622185.1 type II toxin-antitoxin system RelE/ParE family toxin [Desulfuromonadales bacterium]